MVGISTLSFSLHLVVAILMGATVGLERQWRQRMAGTRTNALAAAGAAAFVMCGLFLDNDPSVFSPISVLHYQHYGRLSAILPGLSADQDIQCIVGHGHTQFGRAQQPALDGCTDVPECSCRKTRTVFRLHTSVPGARSLNPSTSVSHLPTR